MQLPANSTPVSWLPLGLCLWCAGVILCADEQPAIPQVPVPEPETVPIDVARREAATAAHRFLAAPRPDFVRQFAVDDHVLGGIIRSYGASRLQARIALTWLGDSATLDEIEQQAPWVGELVQRRVQGQAQLGTWTNDPLDALLERLDLRRPALARTLRRKITPPKREQVVVVNRRRDVDALTLPELVALAGRPTARPSENETAMKRWMALAPDAAAAALEAKLADESLPIAYRCRAAAALAGLRPGSNHDEQRLAGLDWLENACTANLGLGGKPALYLFRSGKEGRRRFFELLAEHDARGGRVPYVFKYAFAEFRDDEFCAHMETLLGLQDEQTRSQAKLRLASLEVDDETLAQIAGYIDEGRFETDDLVAATVRSLRRRPPSDARTSALATAWVNQMQRPEFEAHWSRLARLHLATGLGTRQVLAAAARRHREVPARAALACGVLGQSGATADVPRLWEITRRAGTEPAKKAPPPWAVQSSAWLAIARLTAHLPPLE